MLPKKLRSEHKPSGFCMREGNNNCIRELTKKLLN